MHKKDLIQAISEITGETKKVTEVTINAFTKVAMDAVAKGNDVTLLGCFSFKNYRSYKKCGTSMSQI